MSYLALPCYSLSIHNFTIFLLCRMVIFKFFDHYNKTAFPFLNILKLLFFTQCYSIEVYV